VNEMHPKSRDSDQAAQPCEVLISICIPTFNRARYLSEAIENLLPQLAPDIELLVYDTGSTDGTRELMGRFRDRYPGIRFFFLDTRRGFDETALLLLEQCRGEYVWLFGSDDLLKEGAIEAVRQRILRSPVRPSFLYLNHEVIGHDGKLLIPSNLGRKRDREFLDGRQCVAWLGLFLGYISACVFRRDPALSLTSAKEFDGSLWMGLHLNLLSLSKGGPALYIGQPLVSARRNPGNTYDYGEVFCRGASRVFWKARSQGIGCFTIYRGMNRTVRVLYLRFCLSWRSDDPAQLSRTFPVMLRTCWMYPWFWLLIVPVRLTPTRLARAVRDRLRQWREQRNARPGPIELYAQSPSGEKGRR
jgi:glycosyltransferase involved in cell wall biosynthesis